jgi:hypothetical protein
VEKITYDTAWGTATSYEAGDDTVVELWSGPGSDKIAFDKIVPEHRAGLFDLSKTVVEQDLVHPKGLLLRFTFKR